MILSLLTDTCDIYSQPDQVNTVELELFSPRVIQVNYDFECTPLFRAIQRKDWEKAAEIATEYPEQVRTWVIRYHDSSDGQRIVRWRMLPIHALFLFSGTHGLAVLFLFIYPDSVSLTDDQDMMPLHLACRNGALFETFEELLTAYPQALHHKDYKGRTPLDLVMISSHRQKEELVSLFVAVGGVSRSSNGQFVQHEKRNQASFSPVSKTKDCIGNAKLLRDDRDIQHGSDDHRPSKDSTPKIITIDKSKNFVQYNTIDVDCFNGNQSSNGSTAIVEKSQINKVEKECYGKIHGQSQASHEKTLTIKPASTARTVTIDPVATTHFFSDSLKKAPKSPRVLKIASEKRKSSIKGQIFESKHQQNQQQALQFSTNDFDHSVQLSPACKKKEQEPDEQQSENLLNASSHMGSTSTPFSNVSAETSSSYALRKTSSASLAVCEGATYPESQTPKLKDIAAVISVSRNVFDKIKPCLQTVSEYTKSEAKMLIQTMRDQRMQLVGKSCSDVNNHKILESFDSAESELKGPSDQNVSLVGTSISKAANETIHDATQAVAKNKLNDVLVHEVEISWDKPERSTNEQPLQMPSEVEKNNNIFEINELQAPNAISASSSSCVVLNDKCKEDSSALPNLRDKADLDNSVQRSVEANEDDTVVCDVSTTIITADFLIAPLNHETEGMDSGSPAANTEHTIDIIELKEEIKSQLTFTSDESHIPVDSNGPQEENQPQERGAPVLSIDILDGCTQVNNISSLACVHEMTSEQNENLKTSDLEEVICLEETSSLGIHRLRGEIHDSIGSEAIGCSSQDENIDEGTGETEGSKLSVAPTHLSDNEGISSHICTDKMSEGAAAAEGIRRFARDKVGLNSESQVDEVTLHVAAAHGDQMEVVSEVAIELEDSSAYNEMAQSNTVCEANVCSDVCNCKDNYLDSFVGHTQGELSYVDGGQGVENTTELYMSSPFTSVDQEAHLAENLQGSCHKPEPVQSDEYSSNKDSDVVSNDSPKTHLPDVVTQQHNDGNIINELELTQTDVSGNVKENDSSKEDHTDTCTAKIESSCDDFSFECERNSLKIIEQTAGDTNKPQKSGPKTLKAFLPLRTEIGLDDEDVHFIDLSLKVVDLIDDTAPGTMCLSALKLLEEKKKKMITSDNKDHVMAKNKKNSDAINKAEESVAEKKNNIPSYVRLHYDAMKLVLKSERRDDDVSSTTKVPSQEEKEVSYVNAGEHREEQYNAINDAVVSKSSTTKFQNNDAIPTYVRLRSPKSTNYFSHTFNFSANLNVPSPKNSYEISRPSKSYRVEKNVVVKERAKEQTKGNVMSSSTNTIVKKHQWQSKQEAHNTMASSNVQLVSPNSGECNKLQLSPGKSFISEQKHLDNCNEKVLRPSMRLRSSWISPSN